MNGRNTIVISALLIGSVVLLFDVTAAAAQDLNLRFRNGLVTLVAREVTVPQILDRWARVGGATIVNGEKIPPGAPVTLQLVDVPERTALTMLLRDVGGYILAERGDNREDASVIDRILILPPSAAPVRNPAPQALVDGLDLAVVRPAAGSRPAAPSTVPFEELEIAEPEPLGPGPAAQGVAVPPRLPERGSPVPGFYPAAPPQGNVGTVGNQPGVGAGGNSGAGALLIPATNPFGVITGGLRPGEVTSMPQPEIGGVSPSGEVYRPPPPQ
jgi:hypothetical protein